MKSQISNLKIQIAGALAASALAGCVSGPSWLQRLVGSPNQAAKVQQAEATRDTAREAVLKQAQISAHETALAVDAAPPSRPVEVARSTSSDTAALLDQANGGLAAADAAALRARIAGLLSDNEQLRAAAERDQTARRSEIDRLSLRLSEASDALAARTKDLETAYARERELANVLRAERWQKWAGYGASAVLAATALAWRLNLGNLRAGAAEAIARLQSSQGPAAASVARSALDAAVSRSEQGRLFKLVAPLLARSQPAPPV